MASDTKMLQLVLDKVSSVDRKLDKGFKEVNSSISETEKKLMQRIDRLVCNWLILKMTPQPWKNLMH